MLRLDFSPGSPSFRDAGSTSAAAAAGGGVMETLYATPWDEYAREVAVERQRHHGVALPPTRSASMLPCIDYQRSLCGCLRLSCNGIIPSSSIHHIEQILCFIVQSPAVEACFILDGGGWGHCEWFGHISLGFMKAGLHQLAALVVDGASSCLRSGQRLATIVRSFGVWAKESDAGAAAEGHNRERVMALLVHTLRLSADNAGSGCASPLLWLQSHYQV